MAVIPDLDGRHVAAQHPAKAPDPLRDMVLEFLCLAGQVLELEESAVIAFAGVDETGVDVFEEDSARFVACAAEDPVLDGDILEVVILDAPRRLDFHEAEPAALPHQHVGSREHPLVLECGLEECDVAGSRQQLARFVDRGLQVPAGVDEDAAGKKGTRDFADPVAG